MLDSGFSEVSAYKGDINEVARFIFPVYFRRNFFCHFFLGKMADISLYILFGYPIANFGSYSRRQPRSPNVNYAQHYYQFSIQQSLGVL